MPSSNGSLASQLSQLPGAKRLQILRSLSEPEAEALRYEWRFWARPKQLAPTDPEWRFWLVLAGRGFGKSRTGAEWVNEEVERRGARRIALVAETVADARDVMVEGESGIIACSPPWFRPKYEPTRRRLTWPNGAVATTYTAEEPDQLRGPQHDRAWCDELAKWRLAQETWDQLLFGLRIGTNPRAIVTTTPRPIPIIKELVADPLCRVTTGATNENSDNLAPQFLSAILKKYRGTRLGRQELDAEILDDAPGALWKRTQIDGLRESKPPKLVRVVVAIDPSVSADSEEAETGIVAAGLGDDGLGYVLSDDSMIRPTPEQWGGQGVAVYRKLSADRLVGEVNNGGDLVEANVRAVDKNVAFKQVRASRGKAVRAEPIASLYEQKRVKHVGSFPLLEDQMCQWEPGVSRWSPNRVDALVWALTELMLGDEASGSLIAIPRRA